MIKLGSKKHGLKSNFAFNFISQILTLIIPLITTPYLARVLQETGNGQYSYAFSIITYFTLFANLGFDVYGQRQIAAAQGDIEAKSKVFWEKIQIIRTAVMNRHTNSTVLHFCLLRSSRLLWFRETPTITVWGIWTRSNDTYILQATTLL